jgi:hypothetical protein
MPDKKFSKPVPKLLRWIARIGSLVSAGVLMAFIFGGNERLPNFQEWMGLIFFPGGVLLGMALGWKNELLGGVVTVLSLLAFYAMQLIQAGNFPGGPWFLMFASPGILFLVAWFADKYTSNSSSVASS